MKLLGQWKTSLQDLCVHLTRFLCACDKSSAGLSVGVASRVKLAEEVIFDMFGR